MGALEKSTRRKIFYGLSALFLLVAPVVVLYSRGYIANLHSLSFVPTGGIFVKTVEPGARVFLDRNLMKETSFISRGALITGLPPGRYTVRVEQDDHRPWSKVVRVRDGEVIEFRDIFLPPATITPQALFTVPRALPARIRELSGRSEIVVEVGDPEKPFTLFVVDPGARRAHINTPQVSGWRWDANGERLYLARKREGRTFWYRLPLGPRAREEGIAFRGLPEGFSAQDLTPRPTSAGQFYFFAGGALFLQTQASVPSPIAEQVHAYTITPDKIYYVAKNGFFVQASPEGRDTLVLGRKGLVLDEARPMQFAVSPTGVIALLDSAGGLFLYRPGVDQELQFIAANVKGVDFNQDGDRMAYWDEHRTWLYWVRDNRRQPFQVARTREQVLSTVERIERVFLDGDGVRLFYATPQGLRMSEADSRATPNTYDLVEGAVSDFLFKRETVTLFWAEGKVVYRANLR